MSSVLIALKIVKDLKKIDKDFTIDQKGFNDGGMYSVEATRCMQLIDRRS